MSKFNCIILDPDLSSRMRLKQATGQVVDFGTVTPVGAIHDANQVLSQENRVIDVIFISTRFSNEDITDFIATAKAAKSAQDACFIMIMTALPQGNASLAQNMMRGGDSVLCEPYSVDSLVEITRLAARIKRERADAREKIAVNLLIGDLINQVDLIAYLRMSGCEPGTSVRTLREMCTGLNKMSEEMKAYYFETLVTKLSEAKIPPKALTRKKYGGASQRVKKKIESKIIAEMGKNEKSTV